MASGEETVHRKAVNPKRRQIVLGVGAVIVLLALAFGGKKYLYARAHVSTDDASVDGHIVPVVAKVGGYVVSVGVSENDQVRAGQVVVQLDTAELAVRLAQAEADLAAARAAAGGPGVTGQAEAQVQTAAGQAGALQAQVAAAKAKAKRGRWELDRNEGHAM